MTIRRSSRISALLIIALLSIVKLQYGPVQTMGADNESKSEVLFAENGSNPRPYLRLLSSFLRTAQWIPTKISNLDLIVQDHSSTDAPKPFQEIPRSSPPIGNPLIETFAQSLKEKGFPLNNQGLILATLNGEVLAEHNADKLFNPASVIKVATSLVAILRLGPDFRFRTSLYTDGTLDPGTGILHGSLYLVGGGDPAFFYENGIMIADRLNRAGIRTIKGDLIVYGDFHMLMSGWNKISITMLRESFMPNLSDPDISSAYERFVKIREAEDARNQDKHRGPADMNPPSLRILGKLRAEEPVKDIKLTMIAVHTSLPLLHILKGMNDFSSNWMASKVSALVGGANAIRRFLITEVGLNDNEVSIVNSSGVGDNSITVRGVVAIMRKLIAFLESKGLSLKDILPIAGVDAGTLEDRLDGIYKGSVVAKTGTGENISTIAGLTYTKSRGPLIFVIFNKGGSPDIFYEVQDKTIKRIIDLYGGPSPISYDAPKPSVSAKQP